MLCISPVRVAIRCEYACATTYHCVLIDTSPTNFNRHTLYFDHTLYLLQSSQLQYSNPVPFGVSSVSCLLSARISIVIEPRSSIAMSSGSWELVSRKKDRGNDKSNKLTKAEKKKFIETAPKVEDFCK